MNISGFSAQADIVGRRIKIAWEFVPETGETLANIPPVRLLRKQRDFAYPQPSSGSNLVYDTSTFPPAPVPGALSVTDLDGWEKISSSERHVFEPVSVAVPSASNGQFVEILRRTTVTVYDLSGVPLRQRVEIIDVGLLPGTLLANEVYYYQLFGSDFPVSGDAAALYRSTALVTGAYGLGRVLYDMLPEMYRRQDVSLPPPAAGNSTVPELSRCGGQLRRFIDLFGIPLDSLRGTAEGLRTLHDLDRVDARFLAPVAQWVGWDVTVEEEIPLRRNELKASGKLFRLVGTLPGLRALVSRFTGWITQVGEFAQNIARSNQPPRRNVFAITPNSDGTTWSGVDDLAEILGFDASNQGAVGTPTTAASLTGKLAEPFLLRPGMMLTVTVDGLLPVSLRLGAADFFDISKAAAAEVAAAINQCIPEINAQAQGGNLKLASQTVGVTSSLQISPAPTSLISLEDAPNGRLCAVTDSTGRLRLFYEAWKTPTPPASAVAESTGPPATVTGNYVLRKIHYKTLVDGAWRDSQPIFTDRVTPQADPAALVLPDDRVWLAWLDDPLTSNTALRFGLGSSRTPLPARALGQKREPFALTDGTVLTLIVNGTGTDQYTVHKVDFADLTKASATELAAAMNKQLSSTVATRAPDGSINLSTKSAGNRSRLAINLSKSTAARVLGFDGRNSIGTPGSWSDVIDWSASLDAVSIAPGRHAELAAVNDPAGGVRVAWTTHHAGLWRIVTAHWRDEYLVGTANGVFLRDGTGSWVVVPGLPSPDIRAIAVDSNGTAWIATGAGVTLRHPDGTIAPLSPALPSSDVRDLILVRDGSSWFATAGGIVGISASGTMSTLTAQPGGLPSNDIRALAIGTDGTLWAATPAGAASVKSDGTIQVIDTTKGSPSNTVQDIAIDAKGTVYLATTAGLAISQEPGSFTAIDASGGLAASDVRAVAIAADGTLWVATSGGVSTRSPAGLWTTIDIALGLNSDDIRSISIGPDGSVWVGTAAGVSLIAADGTVTNLDLVGGGVTNPAARAVQTGWSTMLELAAGGGGNREPTLTVDANKRIWLIWSKRIGSGDPVDSWGLNYRIYDPAKLAWGPETVLTAPPLGGRAADRTPSAQSQASGLQIFFASDRQGGFGLWSVTISLTETVGPLGALPSGASSDLAPIPVTVGKSNWLLYRSDANVSLAQSSPLPQDGRSMRVPDNGTLRRFAGTVAVDLGDLNRLGTRRAFGDMLCYTPNRPDGGAALVDTELYTRGTVGLYVSRASKGAELTQQETIRLRELVQRFVPINLRVIVIVVEQRVEEFVYPQGTGIQESYSDDFPFLSVVGPITDSAAASMPGLTIMQSNKVDNVSANPANLNTLSRRSFFPPLQ
jgi:phage tail-like protein